MVTRDKAHAIDDDHQLDPAQRSTGIRSKRGEVLMTDGPFVDSKEQIDRHCGVGCDPKASAYSTAPRSTS